MLNKTSLVILIIFQLTFLATAQATVIKPAPGNELSVSDILGDHFNLDSLIRIDDGKDIVWGIGPADSISIKVIGKQAGFDNEFGFLSIQNGIVQDDFQSFGVSAIDIGATFEMNNPLSANDDFLLAILTPENNIFSSMPTYNSDAFDHMVTWVDVNDEFHYFVAFEDLLNGGDGDYNDIVIELHNFVDGPIIETNAIPEPFSLALFGLGLAGLGFASGRRKVF